MRLARISNLFSRLVLSYAVSTEVRLVPSRALPAIGRGTCRKKESVLRRIPLQLDASENMNKEDSVEKLSSVSKFTPVFYFLDIFLFHSNHSFRSEPSSPYTLLLYCVMRSERNFPFFQAQRFLSPFVAFGSSAAYRT